MRASLYYTIPDTREPIHSIAIGLDGTMMLLCEEGYREAMVGAATVLRLRSMNYSSGQWEQFWDKVGQYGLPLAT